jgi:hypothetical protein
MFTMSHRVEVEKKPWSKHKQMTVHPLARNNIPKQFICCPTCSLAWLESFPSHTILRSNSWSSFVANWFNLLGPSWKTKALACELFDHKKASSQVLDLFYHLSIQYYCQCTIFSFAHVSLSISPYMILQSIS